MSIMERRMKREIRRRKELLVKQKLGALAMILIGLLMTVLDGDATFLVFSTVFAVPAVLAKEPFEEYEEDEEDFRKW